MVVFNILSQLVNFRLIKLISIALLCLSIGKQIVFPLSEKVYESELKFHVVSNKLFFFANSWFTYQNYVLSNSVDFKPDSEYPFFNESEIKDVLSPFFKRSDTPPNIVFIISESLGKQYSEKEARLGSFTPFF